MQLCAICEQSVEQTTWKEVEVKVNESTLFVTVCTSCAQLVKQTFEKE